MSKINPFKLKPRTDNLKRNTFDMSFVNNASFRIGYIYPVMCKEVIPGDSVHIDPTVFLKTMTMKRPILNDVQVKLSFFYGRNRNLVKGWRDFIGKTDDGQFVMPYIRQTDKKFFEVGSLSDYLNVPCSFVDSNEISVNYPSPEPLQLSGDIKTTSILSSYAPMSNEITESEYRKVIAEFTNPSIGYFFRTFWTDENLLGKSPKLAHINTEAPGTTLAFFGDIPQPLQYNFGEGVNITIDYYYNSAATQNRLFRFLILRNVTGRDNAPKEVKELYPQGSRIISAYTTESIVAVPENVTYRSGSKTTFHLSNIGAYRVSTEKEGVKTLAEYVNDALAEGQEIYLIPVMVSNDMTIQAYRYFMGYNLQGLVSMSSVNLQNVANPFMPDENDKIRLPLSALPYRLYESICNAWYRDQNNNPLLDANGKPVYNEFILNNEQGEDRFPYALRRSNWEQDVFTTAMASPQQGVAPLVGLRENQTDTTLYNLRYKDENGNDHVAKITANGNEISGINVLGKETEIDADLSKALSQSVAMGISINDFRNVNSLQRWLEKNMRRGFRYKEQMQSHFGIELSLEELDMPEYLGGLTQSINTYTQTDQSGTSLGDEVGKGAVVANTSNSIDAFFDEHGYIMACLTIVPVPTYSQVLPKHFLKKDALDYFFPEFNHLGPQAIKYKELCPVQTFNESNGSEKLEETFGYQRAWYDYLSSFDEVHGEMRTTMKNYLMNREFAQSPELGADFIEVDENQVNDVFVYTENTDKIYGQVKFDFSMKRPISMFGEPSLE